MKNLYIVETDRNHDQFQEAYFDRDVAVARAARHWARLLPREKKDTEIRVLVQQVEDHFTSPEEAYSDTIDRDDHEADVIYERSLDSKYFFWFDDTRYQIEELPDVLNDLENYDHDIESIIASLLSGAQQTEIDRIKAVAPALESVEVLQQYVYRTERPLELTTPTEDA